MDKILDMIAGWQPLGQGIFFFVIALLIAIIITECWKNFVALVRGWPNECCCEEEEEDAKEDKTTTRRQR